MTFFRPLYRYLFFSCIFAAVLVLVHGCGGQGDAEAPDLQAELEILFRNKPEILLDVLQENRLLVARLVEQGKLDLEEQAWRQDVLEQFENPLQPVIEQERIILGNPDAGVTLVEYYNFLCPVCHSASQTIRDLVLERPEEMRLVVKHIARDVPSRAAALYFEAIAAQDRNKALEYQGKAALLALGLATDTDGTLKSIAAELGLDMQQLQADLQRPEIRDRLDRDLEEARIMDIPGTPVVLVNGVKLYGFISEQEIKRVLSLITDMEFDSAAPQASDEAMALCLDDYAECD